MTIEGPSWYYLYMRDFSSFERESLENADLDLAYEKAKAMLNTFTLRENDFETQYRGRVREDKETVARLEERFAKEETAFSRENKKLADIFEALVLWNGEQNEWFGPHAQTLKTTKYDDYVNGVDMVIEFHDEAERRISHLGLAVDVTFTTDTTKKFDRLRKQIEDGELAHVDYFHSEAMGLHGALSDLPEVVIGADRRTVLEVTDLWVERQNSVLARHKIQIMILTQMKGQLEAFSQYARMLAEKSPDQKEKYIKISARFDDRLTLIDELLRSKEDIIKEVGQDLGGDAVHSEIMSFLKRWTKSMDEESQT